MIYFRDINSTHLLTIEQFYSSTKLRTTLKTVEICRNHLTSLISFTKHKYFSETKIAIKFLKNTKTCNFKKR